MTTKTLKKLRNQLIKELPFFPNNRETLVDLENQSLTNVLIHYLHWKTRLIPPRKRSVSISPKVTADKRWKTVREGVNGILQKIRNGEDITPHLSHRVHSYGYTPASRIRAGEVDSWEDKDQLLNTKGFHHFHIDMRILPSNMAERSNELLFAHVSRDKFHAIGIFDHSVFDAPDKSGNLSIERSRMFQLHEEYMLSGLNPNSFYLTNPVMMSGHPVALVRAADYYYEIISNNDSSLGSRTFANSLYSSAKMNPPNKFKLEWEIKDLDLSVFDTRNKVRFVLYKGPI
ncbi:hypothetical protein N5F13_25585 [Comamonas thiooxydans]|uniref:hypothetical protein n=1 Tax=Comamonas thiooxydans TaxID=363952 RepID=UPI0024471100|nr:hypothetical protein [Comamonas thiooxydans]MDH1477853.1 hypothetical protein [Comamonas thiooxydans]